MRYFRKRYKDKSDKVREAPRWYLDFCDHLEIRRVLPASEDEETTRLFGNYLHRLIDCRKHKDEPNQQLRAWIKTLDKRYTAKFIQWGLLSGQIRKGILADELAIFCSEAKTKCSSMITSRIRVVFNACGFKTWTDIDRDKIEKFLDRIMAKGITRQVLLKSGKIKTTNSGPLSQQTRKHYVRAIVQFCNWYIERYRIEQLSPVHGLKAGTVKELKHPRRPLTDEEITKLLESTEQSNQIELGLPGPERKLLYLVALNTGLRLNELRCLRGCDFINNQIALPGKHTKNGEIAFQPLPKYVADELRQTPRFEQGPLFRKVPAKGAKMLKRDLAAAGVPYKDYLGRYADFHSLRHTYCRILYDSGVDVKTAQQLMRHHDIKLTLDTYAQFDLEEKKRQSVANLPTFQTKKNIRLRGTG